MAKPFRQTDSPAAFSLEFYQKLMDFVNAPRCKSCNRVLEAEMAVPFKRTKPIDLFNLFTRPLFPPKVPLARDSDPISSHEAGDELTQSGRRKAQMERILFALRSHPGSTTHELKKGLPGLDEVKICKRLNDLKESGLAEKTGIRLCRVSRRRIQTWRAK